MTITTTAKARFYIGPVTNADLDEAGYSALSYVEVNEIEDLGQWGAEGKEVTFVGLADGYTRRLKGSIDSGSVELVCARDPLDNGQNAMRAAAETWDAYAFKVVLNDQPTPTGTPTTFYFRGPVLSAKNSFGTADDVTKTNFIVGITGKILEAPADVVVTLSPVAGALNAATDDVAYSTTIAATGGLGVVTYAVTTGTLPAGLTLNAATGVISGTPTDAGTSNFTVTATYSVSGSASAAYSLTVGA